MAEEESVESRNDENKDNIFEIMQKQPAIAVTPIVAEDKKPENCIVNTEINYEKSGFRNLPGLQIARAVGHVSHDDENKHSPETASSPPVEAKRPKLTISPTSSVQDLCPSPETGKRKRIHHDYRRLSNSGYLDDYVRTERRFSSTGESDASVSPSPPKVKPPIPTVKIKLTPSQKDDVFARNGTTRGKLYIF